MPKTKDTLFATPSDHVIDFAFDERVANVFDDMIDRSVPGYRTVISLLGVIAEQYVTEGSNCYDLGCSLGAATLSIRRRIRHTNCRIIGVDNAAAMLERCAENIAADPSPIPVELVNADILDVEPRNASMVVLNFTLQFIDPAKRQSLIDVVYRGLRPGGVLVLSEKIAFADPARQNRFTELHHAFKRANGYSELEISQKRSALEKVLIPDTIDTHRKRISRAGFASCDAWFQCINFASLIARK